MFLQCVLTALHRTNLPQVRHNKIFLKLTVLAERPFVQYKADRMIVSVEHSKLLKARSLSNILNLIPGVNYDGEGGITIMGKVSKYMKRKIGKVKWGAAQKIFIILAR